MLSQCIIIAASSGSAAVETACTVRQQQQDQGIHHIGHGQHHLLLFLYS